MCRVWMLMVLAAGSVGGNAGIVEWRATGSLNYVHPALSEQFAVDDEFTMIVNMEDSATVIGTDRRFFYSVGRFDAAVLGGMLEFENGYSMDLTGTSPGSFNIVNADTTSTSGFDQINLSFQTFDNSLTGEPVAGFEPENLSLSFTDEAAPFSMLMGTGAAFPDFDLPFPGPTTFDLGESTNSRFHFRLQFAGGMPAGTQFVRGSVSDLVFGGSEAPPVEEPGGGFDDAVGAADLAGDAGDFAADANGDGISNGIAYALGIPLTGDTSGFRHRLPRIDGSFWRMIVPGVLPVGIRYELRVTTDLGAAWEVIASGSSGAEWEGSVERETAGDEQILSVNIERFQVTGGAAFFSLRVTLVP